MKETIAGFFAVFVVVPMLIVSQFAFASRTWLLDGDFYRSITSDERLYEGWEAGASKALVGAAAKEGILLDMPATEAALAASYTDAELARLVSSFSGDTVDWLRGLKIGVDTSLDLRELKGDVQGRLGVFTSSYAASVPEGKPSSSRDLSVRPADLRGDQWVSLFSSDLVSILETLPEEVPVSAPFVENGRLPALRSGSTVASAMDRSIMGLGGMAVLIWVTCSMIAHTRWRHRFIWLGSTLGTASVFPIAVGAVMLVCASPLAGAGGTFVAERLSGMVAEFFRAAGNDAQRIAAVLASALSRVGLSFFLTGLVTAAVAAALSSARFFLSEDDREPDALP